MNKKPILVENQDWREKCSEQNTMNSMLKEESSSLPKEDGLVKDEKIVEWVNCAVCNGTNNRQLFQKQGFVFVQCLDCKHIYVHNRIRSDKLNELYIESNADKVNLQLQQNSFHQEYWELVYDKYFGHLMPLMPDNPGVLDIGCGVGLFLSFVRKIKKSWDLYGVELNPFAAEYVINEVGKSNFYNSPLETIDFNRKFGLITMWGVLEHLSDPLVVLGKIRSIINNNGYLLILIPNVRSRAVKILGPSTPTFEPRSHIQFFTDESLEPFAKLNNEFRPKRFAHL